ncbi:MAG: hypothetical protein S4CHLAM2_06870 [Chlamydiales bacterium]|nr:hypothetical protein [Chlamydiales bacterium]
MSLVPRWFSRFPAPNPNAGVLLNNLGKLLENLVRISRQQSHPSGQDVLFDRKELPDATLKADSKSVVESDAACKKD